MESPNRINQKGGNQMDKDTTKKIAIVTDSSVSFSKKEINKYDVHVLPSIITHNNKTYLDQITITTEEVNEIINNNEIVTTSQPNIGMMIETFESIKSQNYDYTIILTVSKYISGGSSSFNQAAQMVMLENYSVVDTLSAVGPAQQGVRAIRKMTEEGASIEEILNYLDFLFANQITYIFPNSLKHIVKSGRVSKTAAGIASILKIKTVLYLKRYGKSVEKLGIARTDKRIFDMIIKSFKENNINPTSYDLYLSENMAKDQVKKFKKYLFKKLGEFNYHIVELPAVLSTHTGTKTLGIQWCLKLPEYNTHKS